MPENPIEQVSISKMEYQHLKSVNRMALWLDISVIVLLLIVIGYASTHLSEARALGSDPCKVCAAKTDSICVSKSQLPGLNYQPVINVSNFGGKD